MMRLWKVLIIFVASELANGEIIYSPSGPVEGTTSTSRDGRLFYAFYGVPYAEPPVGSLRFQNPVPIRPWEQVKNAKEVKEPCFHIYAFRHQDRNVTVGKEDCLIVNIFTPTLNVDKPLAVLFHIHGGGFQEGRANIGAEHFMDEDVVLVTVQYRLGIMGFLSLEDETIPGNFGLKDQSLALSWVKSNIACFGGDPEQITIVGESAGGASVHYHMKSPLSKNLMKRAISESGSVGDSTWVVSERTAARDRALKLADMVGCSGSSQEILYCLQSTDGDKILRTRNSFYVWDFNPVVTFKPVIEPIAPGAFMTEDPRTITTGGIPWLTGVTTSEGILVTGSLAVQNASILDDFARNIDSYLPNLLNIGIIDRDAIESIELIKGKYFQNLDRESVFKGIQDVVSDGYFIAPMIYSLERHYGPKYVYQFDYRGGSSIADLFGKQPRDLGVAHTDEIFLLFNMKPFFPNEREGERQVSKNLVKMWANFAQYGVPSSEWNEWKNGEHLLIQETNTMKDNFDREAANFWSRLPIYKNLF